LHEKAIQSKIRINYRDIFDLLANGRMDDAESSIKLSGKKEKQEVLETAQEENQEVGAFKETSSKGLLFSYARG
ncbi:MAG: hypothetical protein KAS87_06875, partial [Candidatus Omnitrophica bacterium]|nr:hypothetical protein [Candidatus Omnitrophota bacterium]